MKELDINKIWNSDRDNAKSYYESLSDVEKLAKKKSDNILHKINRNMLIESIFTFVIIIIIAVAFYRWERLVFWGFTAFIVPVTLLSFRLYRNFRRDLQQVNQKRVVESLREYVRLTGDYIRRLKVYIYYVTPLGYVVGLVFGTLANTGQDTLQEMLIRIGIGLAVGVPILIFIIWFSNKKYIKWLYGRHHEALRQLLENLEEEE